MKDKNNYGYPSDKPCEYCGQYKNNQSEPRFGYTVCEDHQDKKWIDIQNNKIKKGDRNVKTKKRIKT